jgi:hypothetical protein
MNAAGSAAATARMPPPASADHLLPAQGRLPLALLAAIGERLAARALALQDGRADAVAEGARLERWGLQLQELAQVVARAAQLRQEPWTWAWRCCRRWPNGAPRPTAAASNCTARPAA